MKIRDLELLELKLIRLSRVSFWAYRRYMHPNLLTGWFQYTVCQHLQQWYEDYIKGKRPVLILNTPPQHGKSDMIVDFVTWLMGIDNRRKVIYASFSDRLSIRANLKIQRTLSNPKYKKIFPNTILPKMGSKTESRTRDLLELMGADGSFRNTTVKGSITGESLDIGIIDDPIKGRAQANSVTERDTIWEWFTDDFFSRFADSAGMISIATRWHLDDPIGRLIDRYKNNVNVVIYPAIAEKDEKYRKVGDALFPELKSKEFLLTRKSILSPESWESLYQQHPVAVGGNLIKTDRFKRYKVLPVMKYMRIFADTAAKTKEINDFTVFGLYGISENNKLYVIDILRGKWEFNLMKQHAKDFWNKYKNTTINGYKIALRDMTVEDASAGTQLIQSIKDEANIPIVSVTRSKDKYTRLMDIIGYIDSGYVYLPEDAPWVIDYVTECQMFTGLGDTHDDQVDTLIDAIAFMLHMESSSVQEWENIDND